MLTMIAGHTREDGIGTMGVVSYVAHISSFMRS
jgi:hypothetical protein